MQTVSSVSMLASVSLSSLNFVKPCSSTRLLLCYIINNIIGLVPEYSNVGDPLFMCEWEYLKQFQNNIWEAISYKQLRLRGSCKVYYFTPK